MVRAKKSVCLAALMAAVALYPLRAGAQTEAAPAKREVLYRTAPVYPDLARRCNLRGDVRLYVTVAADGKVSSTIVAGGNPVLAQSAVDAVRNWKFAPAPRTTTEQIELRFGPR